MHEEMVNLNSSLHWTSSLNQFTRIWSCRIRSLRIRSFRIRSSRKSTVHSSTSPMTGWALGPSKSPATSLRLFSVNLSWEREKVFKNKQFPHLQIYSFSTTFVDTNICFMLLLINDEIDSLFCSYHILYTFDTLRANSL